MYDKFLIFHNFLISFQELLFLLLRDYDVLKAKDRKKYYLFVDLIAGRTREEWMRKRGKNNCGAMNCRPCHWPALHATLIAYYQKALTSVHTVDETSVLQLRSVGATVILQSKPLNAIYRVNEK